MKRKGIFAFIVGFFAVTVLFDLPRYYIGALSVAFSLLLLIRILLSSDRTIDKWLLCCGVALMMTMSSGVIELNEDFYDINNLVQFLCLLLGAFLALHYNIPPIPAPLRDSKDGTQKDQSGDAELQESERS